MTAAAVDLACTSCGARLAVPAGARTTVCPYCDTPSVIERPPGEGRLDPTFVVGFVVDQARATDLVRRWLRSRGPFAVSRLRSATLERVRGLYLPTYLYAAVADAEWTAEIGEDYQEEEVYYETDEKGNRVRKTRMVTKTEWSTLSGSWSGYVNDVVVTASSGVSNDELEAIEPFDLRALRRYGPALIAGWIAEEPSLDRERSLALAREEGEGRVAAALSRFMPGDHSRSLRYDVRLEQEVLDLVLLPVWVFAARWRPDRPPVKVLVNGQTGEVQGHAPLSWIRIALAVLAALAVVGAICWQLARR
jgi:hypothetical protein